MSKRTHKNTKGYRRGLRELAKEGYGHAANGRKEKFTEQGGQMAEMMQAGYKVGKYERRKGASDDRGEAS